MGLADWQKRLALAFDSQGRLGPIMTAGGGRIGGID
jgi:hypothetical protein